MPQVSDQIRVRRLYLKAHQGEQEQVTANLEHANWPTTMPGETLFLRRLAAHGAATELGARAASQAQRLATEAVDGQDPAADSAEAVRFASPDTLLACLVRDLLRGQATARWFWRSWSDLFEQPSGTAAARALADEPLRLPSILAQLAERDRDTLWHSLTPGNAASILTSVQAATGWSLTDKPAHATVLTTSLVLAELGDLAGMAGLPASPPVSPGQRIAPGDPRLRLAALLVAWQRMPQRLAGPDGPRLLSGLELVLAQAPTWLPTQLRRPSALSDPVPAPADVTPGSLGEALGLTHSGSSGDRAGHAAADSAALQEPARYPMSSAIWVKPQSNDLTAPPTQASAEPHDSEGAGLVPARPRNATKVHGIHVPTATETPPPEVVPDPFVAIGPTDHRLITTRGGTFFLLNFLKLPQVQAQLLAAAPPNLAAGWIWLYQLATALGAAPDPSLARFLASQAGLAESQALTTIPPAPNLPRLLHLGEARFGPEVWNPGLCMLPALILATPSHLDCHFRLADARLAVRRVGLDWDPGWLPWLGRVVSFHFDDPPDLAGWGQS